MKMEMLPTYFEVLDIAGPIWWSTGQARHSHPWASKLLTVAARTYFRTCSVWYKQPLHDSSNSESQQVLLSSSYRTGASMRI